MRIARAMVFLGVVLLAAPALFAAGGSEQKASTEVPTIEIFQNDFMGLPLPPPEKDPYRQYLNAKLGANFELTLSKEFSTQLTTRFVAKNPPDIILFTSNEDLRKIYAQGVLLPDWTPYLAKMPTAVRAMGEFAQKYFTQNGKLTAISIKPNGQKWAFEIRKDWLEKLKLNMPKTPEELLTVARAFTRGDPDGDGVANTYAFTSTGSGKGIGEIANLMAMYSPLSWYITADGKVSHPILNGGHEEFLKWMKTVYAEKLIDPDWYTQGWDERKPNLFKGKFGVVWYPPMALLNEIDIARGGNSGVEKWWRMLSPPKGSDIGGKLPPAFAPYFWPRTVPATLAGNKAKMDIICGYLELTAPPNEGAHAIMYGRDIDDHKFIDLGGGYWYYDRANRGGKSMKGETEGQFASLWDWAFTMLYEDPFVIQGSTPQPGVVTYAFLDLEKDLNTFQRYGTDEYALTLDPTTVVDANNIMNEFEIKYIRGEVTDYAKFRADWLAGGGKKLLEQAQGQFKAQGMIK